MVKSRLLVAIRIVAVVAGFAGVLTTQVHTKSFFDTVSIKPIDPRGNRGPGGVTMTAGFQPGGRFTAVNATLHMLIIAAYRGSWPLQTGPALKVDGGDAWTRTDGYSITAQADGASRDEMEEMLKAMLVERFALKTHEETQQLPAYKLVMARKDRKPGPQLTPSVGPCVNAPPSALPDPSGLPYCVDRFKVRQGAGLLVADATMEQLAVLLMRITGTPVYDQTGLAGKFDMDALLEARPDAPLQTLSAESPCPPSSADVQNGPGFGCPRETTPGSGFLRAEAAGGLGGPWSESMFDAMQKQLGLKLESTKGPGAVIVIDRAERPLGD